MIGVQNTHKHTVDRMNCVNINLSSTVIFLYFPHVSQNTHRKNPDRYKYLISSIEKQCVFCG